MRKLQGVSLFEVILAFAIGASIILLGVRQYTYYKRDRDAFALKNNVDTLFQAMRNYYYANCSETGGQNHPGTLAPSSQPNNPFPIDINTVLAGYFDTTWRPANPFIDTSFANLGYEAQFNNFIISDRRSENFCYFYPGTNQKTPNCASLPNTSAHIYLWVAQVVVKVKDPKMTLMLKGVAGADCALNEYESGSIVDCSQGATSGEPPYLVWQHLPSFASSELSSGLWRSTFTVKQFNLQYTNDSLWELVSAPDGTTPSYYLCGG